MTSYQTMARERGTKTARQGPQFVQWFGAVLDALRSLGDSGTNDEVIERVAKDQRVPDEQLNELMASGEPRFRNQVQWARFFLAKEGLIDSSRRGVWSLTEKGRATRLSPQDAYQIYVNVNQRYNEERRTRPDADSARSVTAVSTSDQPAEDYTTRLLAIIQSLTPSGFERLAQRILREAGFSSVEVSGRSGDGGIDGSGTLQLNPLVSIKVLFQCKRYRDSVSSDHVRNFRGAMQGRADKGLFITTGSFTADSRREASRDGVPAIELIDGTKLIAMLESLQLGLKPIQTFEIDESFFDEFRV